MENLAHRALSLADLSPGRVSDHYRSKDKRQEKAFDALEWPCPVK